MKKFEFNVSNKAINFEKQFFKNGHKVEEFVSGEKFMIGLVSLQFDSKKEQRAI